MHPRSGGQSWADVKKMTLAEAISARDCLSLAAEALKPKEKR